MSTSPRRYLLLALTVAALVTGGLAWPAHAWKGSDGLWGLVLAGLICMLGAVAGHLVGGLMRATNPAADAAPQATQAAAGARLVLSLLLSVPVLVAKPVGMLPFAIALGIHYLAQVAVEVFVSLRELSQNHRPTGKPARSPQPEAALPSGSTAAQRVDDAEGATD